jgi:hypothetical protein
MRYAPSAETSIVKASRALAAAAATGTRRNVGP